MKATCPNNPEHKKFVTTGHIMQDWLVDEYGNWLDTVASCLQITHEANPDNVWTCLTCGSAAMVER